MSIYMSIYVEESEIWILQCNTRTTAMVSSEVSWIMTWLQIQQSFRNQNILHEKILQQFGIRYLALKCFLVAYYYDELDKRAARDFKLQILK